MKKEQEQEKAKNKQQKLIKKLNTMKEKMIVGSQAIEVAKAQSKELKKTKKQLLAEAEQHAAMQMKLEEEEQDLSLLKMKFTNMQEELDFKKDKLEKIWERLQQANGELA
jgi:hypothetical protein